MTLLFLCPLPLPRAVALSRLGMCGRSVFMWTWVQRFFFFSKLYLNILAKSWSRSQPHSPPAPMGAGVQPKDKACRTLLPYRHPLELGGSTKGN